MEADLTIMFQMAGYEQVLLRGGVDAKQREPGEWCRTWPIRGLRLHLTSVRECPYMSLSTST